MFSWYRTSALCIVLLEIANSHVPTLSTEEIWFIRGWTLQELLAPSVLKFYIRNCSQHQGSDRQNCRRHWQALDPNAQNDKNGNSPVLRKVSEVTEIPLKYLQFREGANGGPGFHPGLENVGQRMAWAASRKTTRTEDLAYCLLGIFGISMPILYGEKHAAFFRLQEEILKRTNDKSLLNWTGRPSAFNSMLAMEPKCFARNENSDTRRSLNPLKNSLFYISSFTFLWNYDAFMVLPDYAFSFVFGEVSNISEVGSTLTSIGFRGKFQLYNVTRVAMKSELRDDNDFYRYEINANGIWSFEVETTEKLDARVVWSASSFSMYRVAVLHTWHHLGGFNTFKSWRLRPAILLEKEETTRPFSFKRRIPTKKPIMVQMSRGKWLVPQIIYIK